MSELLRLVQTRLAVGGGRQPGILPLATLADLDQGSVLGGAYSKERGSFAITAPTKTVQSSPQGDRYGGSIPVGETHENGAVSAKWWVTGAAPDLAIANADALARYVNDPPQIVDVAASPWAQRYIEWRPDGASRSTLFELRGPGTLGLQYDWSMFKQNRLLGVDIAWPVAPLARGLPLDLLDNFTAGTVIGDFAFDNGAGTLSIGPAGLTPSSTARKRFYNSARGYRHADFQKTIKITTGPTVVGYDWRIGKRLDATNSVEVRWSGGNLFVSKRDGGASSNLSSGAAVAPAPNTTYWLRFRSVGDAVVAELFTSEPTPVSAPANTKSVTLAGADVAKYGAGVEGDPMADLTPADTGERYTDWRVEPYTYRLASLPAQLDLDEIPGSAPAEVDVEITPSGSSGMAFGLVSLSAGSAPVILDSAAAFSATTWVATPDGGGQLAMGGTYLGDGTPTSAETYRAIWNIDSSAFDDLPFSAPERPIEIWARVRLGPSLVSPRLRASTRYGAAQTAASRYTLEYQNTGKYLTVPTSVSYKFVKLGTIMFNTFTPGTTQLVIDGFLGAGSAGSDWGVDYVLMAPADNRACGPTGKTLDANYPVFTPTAAVYTKRVFANLRGLLISSGGDVAPHSGLSGPRTLEVGPGPASALVKLSDLAPDDPTPASAAETLTATASVHFSVFPRYYLARGD